VTLVLASLLMARSRRLTGLPIIFLSLAVLMSLFTVSDLFITHYALVHPLAVALAGIAATSWRDGGRWTADGGPQTADGRQRTTHHAPRTTHHATRITQHASRTTHHAPRITHYALRITHHALPFILSLWLLFDLWATIGYHQDLTRSGGLAAHSHVSYHLSYHLRYNGLGAPIALDWGFDAPIRYLSEGSVRPIEIFGYTSVTAPDDDFQRQLVPFLENADNIYLLHAPGQAVFNGRREAFFEQVHLLNKTSVLERSFAQKDGTPLFELWRVVSE
jgi:hypothetical protein